jgi:hypothetical protein
MDKKVQKKAVFLMVRDSHEWSGRGPWGGFKYLTIMGMSGGHKGRLKENCNVGN